MVKIKTVLPNGSPKVKHPRAFRLSYIFLSLLVLPSLFSALLTQADTQAAYVDLNAQQRARSYGYYRALDYCVTKMNIGIAASANTDGMSTDPMNGYWFGQGGEDASGGNPVDVVPYKSGAEGGRTGCADAVKTALGTYWNISYTDFLKGIGYSWNAGLSQWVYSNASGSRPAQLKALLASRAVETEWNDGIAYNIYNLTYNSACKSRDVVDSETNKTLANNKSTKGDDHYTWIYKVNTNGAERTVYTYQYVTKNAGTGGNSQGTVALYQGNNKMCSDIASILGQEKYAQAAYDELLTDKCKAAGVPVIGRSADGQRSACIDGARNKNDENYCKKYTNQSYSDACVKGQGVVLADTDLPDDQVGSTPPGEGESGSACQVEGIGWILCPVINAMADMTDATFNLVIAFMNVTPLGFATDNPLYATWAIMRNIANVAFVLVFLIIIYSQITGAGISNYGVKKMLPRLVIAAILVNLSYFICALAVDVSNILGVSIQQALTSMADTVGGEENTIAEQWGSIATSILSLGTIGAASAVIATALASTSIWAMLAGLLPLLVSALFALIIAFLVLLARQAFIIMLIVLSPLAFVAFLLPNTENLFKKWRSLFITLLALFPMMGLVFGGAVLASSIMRQGSESMDNPILAFFTYLGSVAILAIPFFVTPLLIKLSSGVLNRFAGFINNPHKGPIDRMRKGAERIGKDARNKSYGNKLEAGTKRQGFLNYGARRKARVDRTTSGLEGYAKNAESEYIGETLQNQLASADKAEKTAIQSGSSPKDAQDIGSSQLKLATRMAGGNIEQARITSQKVVASIEAEDLRDAMQPLVRQLSIMEPSMKKAHLEGEVAAGGTRASAALNYSGSIGDTKFLADQMSTHATNPDIVRRAREAISANAGAITAKAPDLVKGPEAAFENVKGSDLVGFKKDTMERMVGHLQGLHTKAHTSTGNSTTDAANMKKYVDAANSFNAALKDISLNNNLQGQFGGELGVAIRDKSAGTPIAGDIHIAHIGPDGKIR